MSTTTHSLVPITVYNTIHYTIHYSKEVVVVKEKKNSSVGVSVMLEYTFFFCLLFVVCCLLFSIPSHITFTSDLFDGNTQIIFYYKPQLINL